MPYRRAVVVLALVGSLIGPVAGPARAGVILNTLQGFARDEPGWSGKVDAAFSASGGNTERVDLAAGGRAQWLGDSDRWQLIAAGEYEESGGDESARSLVVHLRQNHRLARALHTVAFAQRQHDPFQRLQSRWLLGAGLQWDLANDPRGRLAIGATPMLEVERLQGEVGHQALGRLSTFLVIERTVSEGVRLDGAGFLQPAWADFHDFRASASLTLVVAVTGALDLRVGYGVEHDDAPPPGVAPGDWSTTVGFSLRL